MTPGQGTGGGWGLNIGAFMACYRDWLIRGRSGGLGWTAQRRDASGRPRGRLLEARTLDELAALIEAARESAGRESASGGSASGGSA